MGASPGAAVALTQMNAEIDVRNVLASIRVPSLCLLGVATGAYLLFSEQHEETDER